jgi:hypothetical protein
MSKPMGILKRKEVQEQQAAPPAPPDTFVTLIAHVTENWGRTLRFISILLAAAAAICVIVLACRGIRPTVRYTLPAEIFAGSTVISLSTIGIRVRSVRRRRDGGAGQPPPK